MSTGAIILMVLVFLVAVILDDISKKKKLREALKPPGPRPGGADAREATTEEQRKGGLL